MAPRRPTSRFSDDQLSQLDQRTQKTDLLVQQLHTAVLGVEGKGGLHNYVTAIHDMVKLQNGRVSQLEKWRTWLAGAWLATVTILGATWKLLKP